MQVVELGLSPPQILSTSIQAVSLDSHIYLNDNEVFTIFPEDSSEGYADPNLVE